MIANKYLFVFSYENFSHSKNPNYVTQVFFNKHLRFIAVSIRALLISSFVFKLDGGSIPSTLRSMSSRIFKEKKTIDN